VILIVPTLNGWDRIPRLLHSIDVPARVVIVDNNQSGRRLGSHAYIRPIANLGFAGSINAAIAQTPDEPWWMWAGDDIEFGPGDLAAITALMDTAQPRLVTGDRSDERLLRFAYAALNRECIEAVGLLDEWTFFPAYFDDDDYEYRCRLGGVSWVTYNGAILHSRSATIRTDAAMAAANARTFPENAARYVAKWGGPPGSERFSRPWDKPVPLSYAPPDIAGRASRTWRVPPPSTK
jgi:GT2 family glycosyltransferase